MIKNTSSPTSKKVKMNLLHWIYISESTKMSNSELPARVKSILLVTTNLTRKASTTDRMISMMKMIQKKTNPLSLFPLTLKNLKTQLLQLETTLLLLPTLIIMLLKNQLAHLLPQHQLPMLPLPIRIKRPLLKLPLLLLRKQLQLKMRMIKTMKIWMTKMMMMTLMMKMTRMMMTIWMMKTTTMMIWMVMIMMRMTRMIHQRHSPIF
jgi:hypothetical protein